MGTRNTVTTTLGNGVQMTTKTVGENRTVWNKKYSVTECLHPNGAYSREFVKQEKGLGSQFINYYKIDPKIRKFALGLSGKLQKLGLFVAQDSKGCERPLLKSLGEIIFKMASKVR